MNQLTFSDIEYSNRKKKTKRVKFLLHSLIAFYLACFLTTQEEYFYPRPTCIFRI